MPRGGARPGAGRKKKATAVDQVAATITTDGAPKFDTAKDFAMWLLNNPAVPLLVKVEVMKYALPFTDPKLVEEAKGKKGAAKDRAAVVAGRARFQPPAPPKLAVDNT
ncbi:hypothetical protein [Magnetospirillum aberrantis]|uniref:Uncharacterized protein n=1 Tax=Magnetospirillum aberrantis SpK TaxID=908842 RepID=A0A7C9UVY0_9PROT|nr:hypothetical protein [Magnetospirillum aberrantis]NFV80010.1 hypothetical protein [Magnetospirillum aberrantis SpK]